MANEIACDGSNGTTVGGAIERTRPAFDRLRRVIPRAREPLPTSVRLEDEYEQMPLDQIRTWSDAPSDAEAVHVPDRLEAEHRSGVRLWVVTEGECVHAERFGSFGATRSRGELKHTNLTGGAPAYCGGELFVLGPGTVVVNGDSGRYGPRSGEEMKAVLEAFAASGHATYTTGYDAEAGLPAPLIGPKLEPGS